MKIVHAVSNEHGTSKGGAVGDQTGKEIRLQEWYDRRSWDAYLECTDAELARSAAEYAVQIAENDSFGYDQSERWGGYENYPSGGDFDCSSLAIACYIFAGLNIPPRGYSGDIAPRLMKTGLFREYRDDAHLKSADIASVGGIYVAEKKHVAICVGDGNFETDTDVGYKTITAKGSVRVRSVPVTGKTVRILHLGDTEKVLGSDESSGWYKIRDGWVTNNTRYIK